VSWFLAGVGTFCRVIISEAASLYALIDGVFFRIFNMREYVSHPDEIFRAGVCGWVDEKDGGEADVPHYGNFVSLPASYEYIRFRLMPRGGIYHIVPGGTEPWARRTERH
jgi:hypothetical protein